MPTVLHLRPDRPEPRLDRFLTRAHPEHSRSFFQRLIQEGNVTLNGRPAKPSTPVEPGMEVVVVIPDPEPPQLRPEAVPFAVLYEDEDVAVIDKPAGVPVHPSPGHYHGTIVHGLIARWQQLSGLGGPFRPGIVHRLDKDTSGLLLIAKNDAAHWRLAAAWQRGAVRKGYLALIHGTPTPPSALIDAPIARHPRHRQRMAIVPEGRPARTEYHTLELLDRYALLYVRPHTGRTHQVRVHLAHRGHPIVGDPLYGGRSPLLQRQFLHACWLAFPHPRADERAITVRSPLPPDLRAVLERLGSQWLRQESAWLDSLS